MGCCHSTTHASPDERAAAQQGAQQAQQHNRGQASAPGIPQQYRSHGAISRPNVPIRPPSPVPRSPRGVSRMHPPWTRSHLESERRGFFDTRVGQQRHHWDALDTICGLIRGGQLLEAQAILDADNLTVPNGRVARGRSRDTRDREGHRIRGGVYDERGLLYEIPEWCLGDPQDIVEDADLREAHEGVEKDIEAGASSDGTHEDSDSDGGESSMAPAQQKSREEKGKGRAEDIGELFTVTVRFSNAERDVQIPLGSRQMVRSLAQQVRELSNVARVRLIYQGRELDPGQTLEAQGFAQGHVVHAFVFEGHEP